MRHIKSYIFAGMTALMATSCSDFLNTTPKDALTRETAWQTKSDADKFLTGCYDGWQDSYYQGGDSYLFYWDGISDFGYANFTWEGYTGIGNGTVAEGNEGKTLYDFTTIRRCNEFLNNVDKCDIDEAVKKDMKAQARWLRAYRYFLMNWNYGGVPIIENYQTGAEAQVPRNSAEEVKKFVEDELDALAADINDAPSERGRIAKGAAYALRMREALYNEEWAVAKDRAQKIIDLHQYELDPSYSNIFTIAGQSSKEIILAVQFLENQKGCTTVGTMYNNADGGWSSMVPTYALVDAYEMANGLTKDEAGSGYDATHPFNNRDPRMGMTIYYPGCDYVNKKGEAKIFNTLDKNVDGASNANYMTAADNSSKTGLSWAKYFAPITQYGNINNTSCCPIVFRYAEVLLTWCEAENELNGPSAQIYSYLNAIRNRVGMPDVDQAKYGSQEKLRELIRRERSVELAGESLRRDDILRWKDGNGKRLAETVLNCTLERRCGTVSSDASVAPGMRATINLNAGADEKKIEDRKFREANRYLPIPLDARNANPQLTQNDGY